MTELYPGQPEEPVEHRRHLMASAGQRGQSAWMSERHLSRRRPLPGYHHRLQGHRPRHHQLITVLREVAP